VTVHPSYLLRIRPDAGTDVEAEHRHFEADLLAIKTYAERHRHTASTRRSKSDKAA
jgi:hypothetical protein